MWKRCTVIAIVLLVGVLGTSTVLAQGGFGKRPAGLPDNVIYNEEEDMWVPAITDGRVNAFELCCPIAIYYDHDNMLMWNETTNEDGETEWVQTMEEVIVGIDVWLVNSIGVGQLALSVPMAALETAFASTEDVVVAQENGITLGYSAEYDWFWVTYGDYAHAWEAFDH